MTWTFRGLRGGVVTTRWPRRPDAYFETFSAAVGVAPPPAEGYTGDQRDAAARARRVCPTGAITTGPHGGPVLDRGRCIGCGRCVAAAPALFAFTPGSAVASLTRVGLRVGDLPPENDEQLAAVRAALAARTARLRRSVHIRHIDTGSDGSDEWEVQALVNPVYDVHRLGIFFTASPRHADILLVTGTGATGMTAPLARTRAAMPDPVIVIAAGVDATSGGLTGGAYGSGTGIGDQLSVDVWVPGSPASPFALLHGILLALDLLPATRNVGGNDAA